jgi:hypothetical protein
MSMSVAEKQRILRAFAKKADQIPVLFASVSSAKKKWYDLKSTPFRSDTSNARSDDDSIKLMVLTMAVMGETYGLLQELHNMSCNCLLLPTRMVLESQRQDSAFAEISALMNQCKDSLGEYEKLVPQILQLLRQKVSNLRLCSNWDTIQP